MTRTCLPFCCTPRALTHTLTHTNTDAVERAHIQSMWLYLCVGWVNQYVCFIHLSAWTNVQLHENKWGFGIQNSFFPTSWRIEQTLTQQILLAGRRLSIYNRIIRITNFIVYPSMVGIEIRRTIQSVLSAAPKYPRHYPYIYLLYYNALGLCRHRRRLANAIYKRIERIDWERRFHTKDPHTQTDSQQATR